MGSENFKGREKIDLKEFESINNADRPQSNNFIAISGNFVMFVFCFIFSAILIAIVLYALTFITTLITFSWIFVAIMAGVITIGWFLYAIINE